MKENFVNNHCFVITALVAWVMDVSNNLAQQLAKSILWLFLVKCGRFFAHFQEFPSFCNCTQHAFEHWAPVKHKKTNGFWVQKEIKWLICYHTSPMTSVIRILTENTISEFPDVAFFQKNLLWDLLGKVL